MIIAVTDKDNKASAILAYDMVFIKKTIDGNKIVVCRKGSVIATAAIPENEIGGYNLKMKFYIENNNPEKILNLTQWDFTIFREDSLISTK